MVLRFILLCVVLLFSQPLQGSAKEKLSLYTVNYPLSYFAQRIGGEKVNVVFPAPPDVDPAFWAPDSETVKGFQVADIILLNGAGYANWIKNVSLSMLRTVDTSKEFRSNLIHIDSAVTHSHGPGGDHSHGGTAFTTWLDFSQAAMQAKAIYTALTRKDARNSEYYKANFESLEKDLLILDQQMSAICSGKGTSPLLASHPIYQYLARRYNLNIQMLMWEPDQDPGEKQWNHLLELLKTHPAERIIWEGEPLAGSAERLQKNGVKGQVFSPCFAKPEDGDFISVMRRNIKNLEQLLK